LASGRLEPEGIQVNGDYHALDELRFELSVAATREEAKEALQRFERTNTFWNFSPETREHVGRIARQYINRLAQD
jgi:hypothetical protein